jgi:hypothetical protein
MMSEKIQRYFPSIMALLYAIVYVFFWPKTFSIMDESAYLNHAYALRQGHLYPDMVGLNTTMSYTVQNGAHIIPQYPLGWPLILSGFSFLGWNVLLGINLVFHLCSFFLLIRLLRYFSASPYWAILYLLHPTCVIFSRTIMSDIPTGTLLLLSLWLYLSRRFVLLSFVMGIALFLRTANALFLPVFVLAYLIETFLPEKQSLQTSLQEIKSLKIDKIKPALWSVVKMVSFGIVFFIAAYLYQKIIQEGGWAKYSQAAQVSLRFFPKQFLFYGLGLSLLYPGMLPSLFLYRGRHYRVFYSILLPILFLYMCSNFNDVGENILQTYVVGQRYFIAPLPLLILVYALVLEKFGLVPWSKRWRVLAFLAAGVLWIASSVLQRYHQNKLTGDVQTRMSVTQVVPQDAHLITNIHVGKLLHPAWTGVRSWTLLTTQEMSMPDLKSRAIGQVNDSLQKNKATYIAIATRGYRSETSNEQQLFTTLQEAFVTEVQPTDSALQILRVLRAR